MNGLSANCKLRRSHPANDNSCVRITMRHDRITVAVIGGITEQKRRACLFRANELAAARSYASMIAADWSPPMRVVARNILAERGASTFASINPAPTGSVVVRG